MRKNKWAVLIETISIIVVLLVIYYFSSHFLPKVVEISQISYSLVTLFISVSLIFICLWFISEKKKVNFSFFLKKLRFQKITKKTIYIAISIFLIAGILSGLIRFFLEYLNIFSTSNEQFEFAKFHKHNKSPFFITLTVLMIIVFAPLNEEILFRGYLLPKQEAILGEYAWVLNGFSFVLAHILVYDFASLLMISPSSFLIAYKVQKHKDTSIGLLAHLFMNTPFIIKLLYA